MLSNIVLANFASAVADTRHTAGHQVLEGTRCCAYH